MFTYNVQLDDVGLFEEQAEHILDQSGEREKEDEARLDQQIVGSDERVSIELAVHKSDGCEVIDFAEFHFSSRHLR